MNLAEMEKLLVQSPVMSMLREIQRVNNERFAIIVAHGVVEILTNALIEHHCRKAKDIVSDNKTYPHSTKLLILFEKGVLDEKGYKTLTDFRKLRNDAAHGGIFTVTKAMLDKFSVKFTNETTTQAKMIFLCNEIVMQFWGAHTDVFTPYFMIEPIGVPKVRVRKPETP